MAAFDPAKFLSATIVGANSTESIPVPVGEYPAVLDTIKADTWKSKDGTKSGHKLELHWNIPDAALREHVKRDQVVVRQSIMLDLVLDGSGNPVIDTAEGKNIGIGRLRDALGRNNAGEEFNLNSLIGQYAKVSVTHRTNDAGSIFPEVTAVARA